MKYLVFTLPLYLIFCETTSIRGDTFGADANEFDISFVTIGDPGNPPDINTVTIWPASVGSVANVFRMGRYEISRGMVDRANAAGGLELTMFDMSNFGGNDTRIPATGVSWNEAARFVNWMNMNAGFPPAYKFDSQPGDDDYDPNSNIALWETDDLGFDPTNPFRNSRAHYFIPNMDEWHKAAYYDPHTGVYYNYPTGSDTVPRPPQSSFDTSYEAFYNHVTLGPKPITDVGVPSPYGTEGQGGNVYEWNESVYRSSFSPQATRMRRGGDWTDRVDKLQKHGYYADGPMGESGDAGFRVASVASVVGDLNNDWTVDASDAAILFAGWGPIPPGDELADINSDGVVDAADAGVLFANWTGDGAASVPEPTLPLFTALALMAAPIAPLRCTRI